MAGRNAFISFYGGESLLNKNIFGYISKALIESCNQLNCNYEAKLLYNQ
jgi:sulfatase maturation enzyme AslB (radical SAM superfamily)